MNIVFSTTYYHPYVSGLSLYVMRLAEALSARKNNVSVLCMRHDTRQPSTQTSGRVRIMRAEPFMPLHKGFLSFDFVRLAWVAAQNADVIVVNLPQFEGFWPALFGRIHQKKVIAIYHSELDLPSGFTNSVVQSLVEIANMITLLLSESVVTYTQDFANHSRLLRLVRSKVSITFPPVPVPHINIAKQKEIARSIGRADVVIGVAARLAAEKGLEYLFGAIPILRVALKNKRIKIVIAGPDNPVGERVYRVKIRKLEKRYSDILVFLGEIAPDDMGSFYTQLDVLVLPSINSTETFGMVQVEAMMTGVPVVASNLPGVRIPIQTTGMGIVVPPKSAKKIAEAILTILRDQPKYTRDSGRVQSQFSLDGVITFYETLFAV